MAARYTTYPGASGKVSLNHIGDAGTSHRSITVLPSCRRTVGVGSSQRAAGWPQATIAAPITLRNANKPQVRSNGHSDARIAYDGAYACRTNSIVTPSNRKTFII